MMKVTVVIPTRDRCRLVAEALDTVLGQSETAIEVIVVDDASSDTTRKMLAEIDDERLRVMDSRRRAGQARARNRGIAAARGEWIAFLDDDDLWGPDKLRLQLEAAQAADADFVYCKAVIFDEERRIVVSDVTPPRPGELPRALIERNVMPAGSSNILVRADLLDETGGFDQRLHQLADWDLWLRIAEAGTGAVCSEVTVGCRRHRGNMLLTDRRDVRHEFEHLASKHRTMSAKHGAAFNPVAFSHWLASGQRRKGRRMRAAQTHLRAAIAYRDAGHLMCALRAPLGDWAMDLRQPEPIEVVPPEWLRPHLPW